MSILQAKATDMGQVATWAVPYLIKENYLKTNKNLGTINKKETTQTK